MILQILGLIWTEEFGSEFVWRRDGTELSQTSTTINCLFWSGSHKLKVKLPNAAQETPSAGRLSFLFPIIFDVLPQVAGLASVMGVDAMKYKGDSQEVDDLCVDLQKLMR